MPSLAPARAIGAVAIYWMQNARGLRHEPAETVLSDMVADVLLWALAHGLDPDEIIDTVEVVLRDERGDLTSEPPAPISGRPYPPIRSKPFHGRNCSPRSRSQRFRRMLMYLRM